MSGQFIEIKGCCSPLANIHPKAQLHPSVRVDAFVTIEEDVVIEEGCWIAPNAVIMNGSRIGKDCSIFSGAIIGGIPQDRKFFGEYTKVYIGDRANIREYVTINRGTAVKRRTVIGQDALIMAYSHVGHDCEIGDRVVISNATHLAGEVIVGDDATISASVLVHQFCRIGKLAMIQGGTRITQDVPPFVKIGKMPATFMGTNWVGMQRKGYTLLQIDQIRAIYRLIYSASLNVSQAVVEIVDSFESDPDLHLILNFIRSSKRGIIK